MVLKAISMKNIILCHKDIKVLELQFVYKITHYNEKSYLFSFDIDSRIFEGKISVEKIIMFSTFVFLDELQHFCSSFSNVYLLF